MENKLFKIILELMMKTFFRCLALLMTVTVITTGAVQSQDITMERWVIGSGGMVSEKNSDDIDMSGILGQFAVENRYETAGVTLKQGFWVDTNRTILGIDDFLEQDNIAMSANLMNYPNPMTNSTSVKYTLPASGLVTVKIYDMVGRVVKLLVDDFQAAGDQARVWDGIGIDGQPVPAGTYLYELTMQTANSGSSTKSFQLRNMLVVVR
jgi:hypothetical protein